MTENASRTYLVAEMACSHEGDPALGRKIIEGAGAAGADAIQLQIWSLPHMVVPHHPDYEKLRRLELSATQWTELFRFSKDRFPRMDVFSCVYEVRSVELCESLGVDGYKLHSSDLSNPEVVRRVAGTGKPLHLSIGASTVEEIGAALGWIREAGAPKVRLMYGYQSFPTPTDAIHLRYMRKLMDLFGLPLGYQDHSEGSDAAAFWLPAAAMGIGVECLEKHITHDRSYRGVDHESALDPEGFREFVRMVRVVDAALGLASPREFSQREMEYRRVSKKSLVAGRDLPAGTRLTEEDLRAMRGDVLGIPPDGIGRLLGRMTKRAVPRYHVLSEEDFE